ncbi:GPI ethanolamine phosphate transferase protein [Rutstroemia sp. NJR-2017a WRK4]|nr:GPI ethanolamine phosphate transferase protein [Rutstroemia sp. NJR-2017a WRK4]
MVKTIDPKPAPGSYSSLAAQYARAKARQAEEEREKREGKKKVVPEVPKKDNRDELNEMKRGSFRRSWWGVMGWWTWVLFMHAAGVYFFTKGFLLTRLVLEETSICSEPPISRSTEYRGSGTPEAGCWHPRTFDRAVVVIIDALRYDFTVPFSGSETQPPQAFHNALPFLYETATQQPQNAFLLPFIADPPTTTLQRLKGLTTGTLPTFVDAGSNFAGTAIDEDNLLGQLKTAGKKIVHLGDDTWTALFPGYFEANISHAYDSLNVWDLHTVDNGVTEHIMPLLAREKKNDWDVMFAHYLGVDHAGHRYGPNHPAMTSKLQQMDGVVRELVQKLDDNTLLVIMGDHGMDGKGDHGGESDDEVEAALWMYSKKGIFGRTDPAFVTPPQNAKIRPVNQIDLVPTLALLLGLPIPFNNLGRPIEEAFAGKKGTAWDNLASVARMTAAGIKRYQASYFAARGIDESTIDGSPYALWAKAEQASTARLTKSADVYHAFSEFQGETLRICRDLWARFDVPSMILGITILAGGVLALLLYANSNAEDGKAVEDQDLDEAEAKLELEAIRKGEKAVGEVEVNAGLLSWTYISTLVGATVAAGLWTMRAELSESVSETHIVDFATAGAAVGGLLGALKSLLKLGNPLPTTLWGWMAVIFTLSQSIGFASNSYTIWEDSILLFFISTFGVAGVASSLRQANKRDRTLGVYHSLVFIGLAWVASFSKLCREEQMPYCKSTYYASATSSTSAPWQLLIPFTMAFVLPSFIKSYYASSLSYEGFAPAWIGFAFRLGLFLISIFWALDAADDGNWFPNIYEGLLKNIRVPIAQTVFAMAVGAGTIAFNYAPPCISIGTVSLGDFAPVNAQYRGGTRVMILGYGNSHGARYFLLVVNVLLAVLMIQKPMGFGAISLMSLQILSLVEFLDLNSLTHSPVGPIMLALLGSFHFFKTGHQATLSAIQWESAFIPLHTIRYPWSPLFVALNSFGPQILAASAVPLIVFWKQKPKKRGLLKAVAAALAWHVLYYAVVGLATTMWAGWLRRHLMLYRVFSPKFMTAAAALGVVEVVGILVVLLGARGNITSVGNVFGWP